MQRSVKKTFVHGNSAPDKSTKCKRKKKGAGAGKPQGTIHEICKTLLVVSSIMILSIAVLLAMIAIQGERPHFLPNESAGLTETPDPPLRYPADSESGEGEPAPSEPLDVTPYETTSYVTALPPELPPRPSRRTLVFVIDDAGHNMHQLEPFLAFPGLLTIAVLPGLPYSAEAARRAREAGMEVILHQPMEAVGMEDPGPGAIYSWMDEEEILEILRRNLEEIGPVAGMNNHQGSRITADARIMEIVLGFSKYAGIPFLDSLTTASSTASAVARRMGMTIATRDVFLDNDPDRASISRAIAEGRRVASRTGNAVMIGHVWSPELAPLLNELYQYLAEQGYEFATASQLIAELARRADG